MKAGHTTHHKQSPPEELEPGRPGDEKVDAGHICPTTVRCQCHTPRVSTKCSNVVLHPGQSCHLVQQPPVSGYFVRAYKKRKVISLCVLTALEFTEKVLCQTQDSLRGLVHLGQYYKIHTQVRMLKRTWAFESSIIRLVFELWTALTKRLETPLLFEPWPSVCQWTGKREGLRLRTGAMHVQFQPRQRDDSHPRAQTLPQVYMPNTG